MITLLQSESEFSATLLAYADDDDICDGRERVTWLR